MKLNFDIGVLKAVDGCSGFFPENETQKMFVDYNLNHHRSCAEYS